MNVFYEFYKIAQRLHESKTRYALIGGVAMAFYGPMRATKDIDFLIAESDFPAIKQAIENEGFEERSEPMEFASGMTMHRFIKLHPSDDMPMIVDVMIGRTARHQEILNNVQQRTLPDNAKVYLAGPKDMIWLKSIRASQLDQQDILTLKTHSQDHGTAG